MSIDVAQVNLSTRTIGRRLREFGLHARVAVQQLDITKAHAQQRLIFARMFAEKPREFWTQPFIQTRKASGYIKHYKSIRRKSFFFILETRKN